VIDIQALALTALEYADRQLKLFGKRFVHVAPGSRAGRTLWLEIFKSVLLEVQVGRAQAARELEQQALKPVQYLKEFVRSLGAEIRLDVNYEIRMQVGSSLLPMGTLRFDLQGLDCLQESCVDESTRLAHAVDDRLLLLGFQRILGGYEEISDLECFGHRPPNAIPAQYMLCPAASRQESPQLDA
jgi:hypothetical protein